MRGEVMEAAGRAGSFDGQLRIRGSAHHVTDVAEPCSKGSSLDRALSIVDSDLILLDAHVHLHYCFDPGEVLTSSYDNFGAAASRLHPGEAFIGVLVVTDSPGEDGFGRLSRQPSAGPWLQKPSSEETSVVFQREASESLIVIAGRQIRTRENLEVLAIGTRYVFQSGQPIHQLIHAVSQSGALPVIPWGFGKWTASRGKLLRRLFCDPQLPPFFVGDNANRLALWPRSHLFRLASGHSVRNLPGTDLFPLSGEHQRSGSFGAILRGSLSAVEPSRDLIRLLMDPECRPEPYGSATDVFRFVRNQVAIRYVRAAA